VSAPHPVDAVEHRFGFHPATAVTGPLHDAVRAAAKRWALAIIQFTPPGREQALALTAAEESMMRANQAIALGRMDSGKALNPHSGKTAGA
jgi:hypothetical protein